MGMPASIAAEAGWGVASEPLSAWTDPVSRTIRTVSIHKNTRPVGNSACRIMHVLAHFARFILHNIYGGAQLLSRHIPINIFLRLSP